MLLPSAASPLKKSWGESMTAKSTIKVTQTKSSSGRLKSHRDCVRGLGLKRIGHTVEVEDTPSVRGMINTIYYMVRVEG
jgi:large subunit ribosomal protein L30